MVSIGSQALVLAYQRDSVRLWVTTETGARKIESIQGKPVDRLQGLFKDHLGVIWLRLNTGGIIAINGKDTVDFNQGNSDFKGDHATDFAEDVEGNIWVKTELGGVSVFQRGKIPLSIAKGKAPKPNKGRERVDDWNTLGRKISATHSISQRAKEGMSPREKW